MRRAGGCGGGGGGGVGGALGPSALPASDMDRETLSKLLNHGEHIWRIAVHKRWVLVLILLSLPTLSSLYNESHCWLKYELKLFPLKNICRK